MNDDGTSNTVYPTYRELAEKYGVAPSVIADYAKSHNTMHRRKYGEHRIEARRDEKIIEARATAEAIRSPRCSRSRRVPHLSPGRRSGEGRVRTDSPADVNTLIRSSRSRAVPTAGGDPPHASLEVLSERHERYLRDLSPRRPRWLASSMCAVRRSKTEHGNRTPGGVRVAPSRFGTARRNRTCPSTCATRCAACELARELAVEQMAQTRTTLS